MPTDRDPSQLSHSQLADAAELAKRMDSIVPVLLAGLERAVRQKSPEHEAFKHELEMRNSRGARRTSGRIV